MPKYRILNAAGSDLSVINAGYNESRTPGTRADGPRSLKVAGKLQVVLCKCIRVDEEGKRVDQEGSLSTRAVIAITHIVLCPTRVESSNESELPGADLFAISGTRRLWR